MNGFPALMSWLAASALCGSVAIVLMLAFRPLIRRWLGARAVHALWLVVLVRLLIPWTPHTPMAVLPAPAGNKAAVDSVTLRAFVVSGDQKPMAPPTRPLERRSEPGAALKAGALELIWLIGVAGVFGISLAGALRAAPLLRRARAVAADSVAMQALASLPMSVRGLRILETEELKSPALCGFIRPAILLPPGWAESMTPEELRCVLLHEIGHHRRGDVLWRWMFLLARAIHWFNPLVWMAEREMRIDQEMACDEWVIARDGGIDSQKYGEALLRACKNLTPLRISSPGHATMAESSAGLARRIRHIARTKTHGWPAFAVTAVLAIALCAIGPSPGVAQNPARASDESPTIPPPGSASASAPPATPSPTDAEKVKGGESAGASSSAGASAPPALAKAKGPLIEIEARFVESSGNAVNDWVGALPDGAVRALSILENPQFQVMIRGLSRMKGVGLASAPRVTCPAGQKAVMEIIREFRYPTEFNPANDGSGRAVPSEFETRNTGITMEVIPTLGPGGRIDMTLTPSVVEFEGFVNYGVGRPARRTLTGDALAELMKSSPGGRVINQPIFEVRKMTTAASIHSGQTLLLGGISRTDAQTVTDTTMSRRGGKLVRTTKTTQEKITAYVLIFVTARVLDPETPAPAVVSPEPTAQPQVPAPQPSPTSPPARTPQPPPTAQPPPASQPPPAPESDVPFAVPVPGKPGYVTSPFAPKAGFIDVRGFPAGTEIRDPSTGKSFRTP